MKFRNCIVLALCVLISSCAGFKPSADLNHFKNYFIQNNPDNSIPEGKVGVTFLGTSSLLIDDGETQILIDGFFSRPPLSKVGMGKVCSDSNIIKSVIIKAHINRLSAIFVCHSHYDHVIDAPAIAKLTGALLHGSASTLNVGKGYGLSASKMNLFVPGRELQIGKFTITVINSKHTPPFKLMGRTNATDPAHPDIIQPLKQPAKADDYIEGGTFDFYIKHGTHSILIKASTNYVENTLKDYPADVFFLGIAMLGILPEEFQNTYYSQTVVAAKAKTVIPIHWDNFTKPLSKPLVPLPKIGDDVEKGLAFLIKKTQADGVDFKMMQSFDRIILF